MSNWLGDMQSKPSVRSAHGQDAFVPNVTVDSSYVQGSSPGSYGEGQQSPAVLSPSASNQEHLHRFAGVGVGLSSVLAEHVLSHPCIVLRRQCQVHHDSQFCHLTPFTLIPTIFNIQRHQSLGTLWKGMGSTLAVKGIAVAAESTVSEVTSLPREVNRHSSLKKLTQHLLLKSVSFIVVAPFYAGSLVETVQSEIASERPGVLDCLREGLSRCMAMSTAQTTRLLPMWRLCLPFMVHRLLHYVLSSLAQYTVAVSIRADIIDAAASAAAAAKESLPTSNSPPVDKPAVGRTIYETYYPELLATFTGNLLADTLLYPLETLTHRLLLQGTRTIIDNTDNGLGVTPIITRYEGFMDALRSIISDEGLSGLYKGFGALLMQYAVHVAVLKIAKFVFENLAAKAAAPASTTPLSDLQRMQQMQAQVRGQSQHSTPTRSPQRSPYSGHHRSARPSF